MLLIAVIISRYEDKWVFCRQHGKTTWEAPAGHREPGETIVQAANRELFEETGALEYTLIPICPYSVTMEGETNYGQLFYADIHKLGPLPPFEIEEAAFFEYVPSPLTYPDIQPMFIFKIGEMLGNGKL
ncbi:NUDIX domain-containing protein [Christensenellaceae bacterium OttesenSCG-928-K19]|nr:NUDIX domain-containing protein [Christensenellaceae bacterium OttesenSCG-928-K19]